MILCGLAWTMMRSWTSWYLVPLRRRCRTLGSRCLWLLYIETTIPSEGMQGAAPACLGRGVAWQSLKLRLILPPVGMMTPLVLAVTHPACFHLMLKASNASLCSVTQVHCGWLWLGVQCLDKTLLDRLSPTVGASVNLHLFKFASC